jgi:hypothetical protein
MRFNAIHKIAAAGALVAILLAPVAMQAQSGAMMKATDTVLKPAQMEKLMPASVYYRGQPAAAQVRNSGGVKFADGYYVLAALVDTSGYSTAVAAKYQAYLIVETPIKLGGETLSAGVYGAGFVGDKFLITDVGGHDVLSVALADDAGMKLPKPLQVVAGPDGTFRLYAGRKYVSFSR